MGPSPGTRRSRAGTSRAGPDAGRRSDTARPQPDPDQIRRPTATAASPAQQSRAVVDNTARILAGAALFVGALGVGVALIVRKT